MSAERDFAAVYRESLEQPELFWREQATLIDWQRPFDVVCDNSEPPFTKWFVGGQTNLCHNAVDRHAATHPDRNALIFVSTETDTERTYTFRELLAEVKTMASVLKDSASHLRCP